MEEILHQLSHQGFKHPIGGAGFHNHPRRLVGHFLATKQLWEAHKTGGTPGTPAIPEATARFQVRRRTMDE